MELAESWAWLWKVVIGLCNVGPNQKSYSAHPIGQLTFWWWWWSGCIWQNGGIESVQRQGLADNQCGIAVVIDRMSPQFVNLCLGPCITHKNFIRMLFMREEWPLIRLEIHLWVCPHMKERDDSCFTLWISLSSIMFYLVVLCFSNHYCRVAISLHPPPYAAVNYFPTRSNSISSYCCGLAWLFFSG